MQDRVSHARNLNRSASRHAETRVRRLAGVVEIAVISILSSRFSRFFPHGFYLRCALLTSSHFVVPPTRGSLEPGRAAPTTAEALLRQLARRVSFWFLLPSPSLIHR